MEDPKAEDPKPDKLWPKPGHVALLAELRSLREQLSMARAEVKRHLTADTLVREQLDQKGVRIRELQESWNQLGTRLREVHTQLSASQDLSRALTWALQQAYRASTIRGGEDS